eukprot:TRINITY_DN2322_c0_g2_i1.p1 TRINITY_DN2322_c0_g2~~TRINITY_DN2322_c0_g2_i1.p1  ORF type:complete len:168 (-),score=29.91 TRINITY_DN2322_c0_g2_i1:238-741(-)
MEFIGEKYEGDITHGRMEGQGKYTLPDGTYYVGDLYDGMFHGKGVLYFVNGGKYEGEWKEGIAISGKYTFSDELEYSSNNWTYCTSVDRRFYSEQVNGLKPAGLSQISNKETSNNIPYGTYDTGDGYYEPKQRKIFQYPSEGGNFIRVPEEDERDWIVKNCRVGSKV